MFSKSLAKEMWDPDLAIARPAFSFGSEVSLLTIADKRKSRGYPSEAKDTNEEERGTTLRRSSVAGLEVLGKANAKMICEAKRS